MTDKSKDVLKESLEAVNKLFANTSPEEFEQNFLAIRNKQGNQGETIEHFLENNKDRKENEPLIFTLSG